MDSFVTVYVRNPRRLAAFAAALVLIIISLMISQSKSLAAERDNIDAEYSDLNNGGAIAYNLAHRDTDCVNLVTMAVKVLPSDDAAITGLTDARTALESAASPQAKFTANQNLNTAFYALYDKLETAYKDTPDSLTKVSSLEADFRSCNDIISHNTYNADAAKFNKKLGNPVNAVLGSFLGVKTLELFGV